MDYSNVEQVMPRMDSLNTTGPLSALDAILPKGRQAASSR